MAKTRDMTVGNPTKHILMFAVPLLLGNVFQSLYNMVDAAIVGKLVGVEALAAVGSSGWLDWMVLGFMMGLTQGYSIMISRRYGAGDIKGMHKSIAMSMLLTLGTIIIMTALSLCLCGWALRAMRTPEVSYEMAKRYLTVIFCGIPITMTYNLLAGMLRAVGNSRTPLIAMVVAAFVNVIFDLLCVAVFKWGVVGAAAATVFGQFISMIICLIAVLRSETFRLNKDDWKLDIPVMKELSALGLPIGGQFFVISVGGVVYQAIINGFGVSVTAGVSAASRFSGILETGASAMGSAMHTFTGQNMGAGRYDRINEGVKKAALIATVTAMVLGVSAFVFGRQVVSLFIDLKAENADAVVESAYYFIRVLGATMFSLYTLHVYRSTLQGLGVAGATLFSSLLQVFMRTAVTYLLTVWFGEKGVYYGDPLAWSSAWVFLMFVYYRKIGKLAPVNKAKIGEG